ncbi:sentrin-specific protease 2 isoform X9 [Aotus nancymaae]|uniref:sentrin-specific protease 2 isoform X9 n=1 Tax=Aotus nancymaae TaxID=37293 RepID=UPI0030FEA8FD
MYRWLVRILGTIFRFCDRSVPPARALLKRRRSNSTLFSAVDTDEIPAKRPRLGFCHVDQAGLKLLTSSDPPASASQSAGITDCFIHQVKNSLYNAASLFGFPFQLTTKPMVTSACNGTRNVAPSGEVFSNSSSCELTGSGSWNNMLTLGNKSPNGISDYPKIRVTVTRDQPRRVLPSLGFTLNSEGYNRRPGGRRHSKGNPESSFMWKPQEPAVTEMISEECGKGLRRPHYTVEEGVQKEEREKYRRLLERLKESGHGNSVTCPVTSNYHSSQRSQMDTLKTKGWGEEQNHGVKTTQFVPKQYRLVETRGPLCSLRSEKRCSKGKISDTEKMVGLRFENESRRGYQLEPDLSEEVSARLRLGSGSNGLLRRKVSIIETKEKNCSGKERDRRTDDLLELTEDMEKEISNALGHGPQDEILSSAFKLRITRGDIQTLKNYHWLNDEVIDLRKKCLKYLDSMGQKGHRICEILLQYLQDESKTKRNIDLNLLEWTHYSMKPHEIPQQLNGSDCGMFTCKYADYISRDKPITFTQVSEDSFSTIYLLLSKIKYLSSSWHTVSSQ